MKKIILSILLIGISIGVSAQNIFPLNGNVGVGTANPTSKLQVNEGDVTIYGLNTSRYLRFTQDNLQGAFLNYDGANNILNIGVNNVNTTDVSNDINAISIARLNGNVGIGTINPDMKLTVKGNIHAEEVKIDLNVPAPDYVFKEDYKLRSIEDLENYIKENSHLPEIPSAKEFEENGVMQGEMDMNLLKKIEELTLYIIQQEKKINALEALDSKYIELEKRLEKLENKN
ncbi:hypothetical protein I2486_14865 [Cellulophaga sp. E16_2]|uniref:Secreted protein n=1 Tax=Cellulophaga algicola (strain DSM 14237 / IC166 / ACAM 630) TaxID=688270 RepID=E6XF46_CELAD|nr:MULTISPECIES: tail fiber protein [Cellulophaga]ADV50282.1 hypothetical protein Celal_3007 [Cellulophaga algicola DSM 14237]MBO0592684.1 hypothetical protein [Cellulophaga sp. E16_2]